MSPTLTILLVGSLVATSCALVGSFLILRRMALLGDAISHAVLPGIAIAFLLTGNRSALPMVIGAGALGVLTVFLVELLNRSRRVAEDAAIGVVFPGLFSLGVLLISRYAAQVDLDLDCVLYGEIAYTPWDTLLFGGRSLGSKALWVNGGVLLVDAAVIFAFFKELKVSTFDPGLSAALGFSPIVLHYLLMSLVSITVVGAFESVGAILVVAMLVVPPATAFLLTDRLATLIALAVAIGVAAAVGGYWLARWWDCSIAGAMATLTGIFFLVALVASPSHGIAARALAHRRLGTRLDGQLVLLHLDRGAAVMGEALARRFGWRRGHLRRVLAALRAEGLVEDRRGELELTAAGARALAASGKVALAHPPGGGAPGDPLPG